MLKKLSNYKVSCSLNKNTPLSVVEDDTLYQFNYESMTYFTRDLLFKKDIERGNFIRLEGNFYLIPYEFQRYC